MSMCREAGGRGTFLCVSSARFRAVQSVTELEHWRNSMESSCVYYAVLSFSQRTSKSEQVLLSSEHICFTLQKTQAGERVSFNPL